MFCNPADIIQIAHIPSYYSYTTYILTLYYIDDKRTHNNKTSIENRIISLSDNEYLSMPGVLN